MLKGIASSIAAPVHVLAKIFNPVSIVKAKVATV
jgi:hypothetical protein